MSESRNIPTKHKNILKILADRREGIAWFLIDSTNLTAQGVEVEPHDIDLLSDEEGAYVIGGRLKESAVEPITYSENGQFSSAATASKIIVPSKSKP